MSEYEEDQANEIEALEAIYSQDFVLDASSPPRSFHIQLLPNSDNNDDDRQPHVSCSLQVTLPLAYPKTVPELHIVGIKGLSVEQLSALNAKARSEAQQLLGEVSVFQICECIKEFLSQYNTPSLSMFEQMEARQKEAQDKANHAAQLQEQERQALLNNVPGGRKEKSASPLGIDAGTIVTVESFMKWKALFDAEQKKLREEQDSKAARDREPRLTGKQLFLQNLVKDLNDDDDEGGEIPDSASSNSPTKQQLFFYNKSLFENETIDDEDDEDADEKAVTR